MNEDAQHPGPRRGDWALLVVSAVFVAMGLLMLLKKPRAAVVTLAFFGGCLALAIFNVVEKRRFSRYRATRVEIAGGVPLRPSRAKTFGVGVSVLAVGGVPLLVDEGMPLHVRACFWLMALAGAALSVLVVLGKAPVGFVQLDPPGITFGHRGYAMLVPWDAIRAIAMGELSHNAALFLHLARPDQVQAIPAHAAARVAKQLSTNLAWNGAHIVLLTSQYGLDLPLVAQALERYVRDPNARSELGRRLPPPAVP